MTGEEVVPSLKAQDARCVVPMDWIEPGVFAPLSRGRRNIHSVLGLKGPDRAGKNVCSD